MDPRDGQFPLEVNPGPGEIGTAMKTRIKLALLLEERGFEKGEALALAGHVYVNGEKETRAGRMVSTEDVVEVRGVRDFVSRSAAKLEGALEDFGVSPAGRVCVDLGSSTGGFCQILLRNDARKVIAVDVGYGQLDYAIRSDPRVVVLDRTDVREFSRSWFAPDDLNHPIFVTCDISFLSLRTILDALLLFSRTEKIGIEGIFLLKPQFEASEKTEKGILKDDNIRAEIVREMEHYAKNSGWDVGDAKPARIKGTRGNQEYVLHLRVDPEKTRA